MTDPMLGHLTKVGANSLYEEVDAIRLVRELAEAEVARFGLGFCARVVVLSLAVSLWFVRVLVCVVSSCLCCLCVFSGSGCEFDEQVAKVHGVSGDSCGPKSASGCCPRTDRVA